MTEQIAVELRVLGHTFRLATTESEKGDLERAAELLNGKYERLLATILEDVDDLV